MKIHPLVLLLVVLPQVACEPVDGCAPAATACSANVAEVCDSDRRWQAIMNCDEVAELSGGTWSCQIDPEAGATCLPDEDAGQ